jgi:uncharacterized protein
MSTIEDNKQIVRRFAETFSNCQFDQLADLMADDATYEFPGTSVVSGIYPKAVLLEMMNGMTELFPSGIQLEIKTITAEEDRVSVEAQGSAVSVSGVPYNNRYHIMYVIRDGKIKEAREYLDTILVDKLWAPPAE